MSSARLLRPITVTLSTQTTSAQYFFPDQWVPIDGDAVMDYTLLLRDVSGTFTAKPCDQLADARPDNPDSPAAITDGSYTGTAGFTQYHETAVGGASKALVRPGIAYKLSSGSSLGYAQVTLLPSIQSGLQVLGSRDVSVHPGMMSSTDLNYAWLTDWQVAVGFSKCKAWFNVTENDSDYMEYQLVLRTATDTRAPNGWQTAEAGYTNPSSSNTERNTGELSAPGGASITTQMFFQLGLAFRKKSGAGGNPRAVIHATTAVIRG